MTPLTEVNSIYRIPNFSSNIFLKLIRGSSQLKVTFILMEKGAQVKDNHTKPPTYFVTASNKEGSIHLVI